MKKVAFSAFYWKCLMGFCFVFCILLSFSMEKVKASYASVNADGYLYKFDEDSDYEISDSAPEELHIKESSFGEFTISGSIKRIADINGVDTYEVSDGNVDFNYSTKKDLSAADSESWHLYEDDSETINGIELDTPVLNGAIIVQASIDGIKWVTEKVVTNVISEDGFDPLFYSTVDIQQINGCYFRVIVVHGEERQLEDGGILFISWDRFEKRKYAEVYTLYIVNSADRMDNGTPEEATPRKNIGELVSTGDDNGYSGNDPISIKDPHYGWELGQFFVNGYTRETKDVTTGKPVFLKNVGDRVTLWFYLKQDIQALNGNESLRINDDFDGFDQFFQIPKTNFKKGTLIIRFTDYEGVKHDPVIYTDYLEAHSRTGANTRVELFEEGDYEVALDYEILDESGIDSVTDYRIAFSFAIRNGNCMVFPIDALTGAELVNNAVTENGFVLDMARSRYLAIDVKRSVVVDSAGGKTEDVRFNRPAKDGDQYYDDGIYSFSVKNLYTGETTEKTIFVGADPVYKGLSKNNLTIKELDQKIKDGYVLETTGILLDPIPETDIPEIDEPKEIITESIDEVSDSVETSVPDNKEKIDKGDEKKDENTDNEPIPDVSVTVQEESSMDVFLIAAIVACIILTFALAVYAIMRRSRHKSV